MEQYHITVRANALLNPNPNTIDVHVQSMNDHLDNRRLQRRYYLHVGLNTAYNDAWEQIYVPEHYLNDTFSSDSDSS